MKTNMHFGATLLIFRYAKELRKNSTEAEKVLCQHLRKNQMGQRFRRQHPIWLFVADFYCHRLKFIIEVDGGIHEEEKTQLLDKEKTNDLENLGIHLLRLSNAEVLYDIDNVLSKIAATIHELKTNCYKKHSVPPFRG